MDLKDHVIHGCRRALLPVIRFLLRHGVTWSEFSELAKDAYVQVARADYGIQGRPTNNSRIAMLTGLSRREVARVKSRILDGHAAADSDKGNQISRILTGWHVDPEFADEHGRPKDLPLSGPSGSLSVLLKRYAGDLPHVAIRKEMQQRELIQELDGEQFRVLRRDYVFSTLEPETIERMSTALHDHAATLEHNLNEERLSAPRFEAVADNANIKPAHFKAFHRLVEEKGMAFLEDIDGWLSRNESDPSEDTDARTVRLGVGVYFISEESEQGRLS